MARIDDPAPPSVPAKSLERRFALSLKVQAPKLPPRTILPTLKNARVPLKALTMSVLGKGADAVQGRTEARSRMNAEVTRLRAVRTEDDVRDTDRHEVHLHKVMEQAQELEREPLPVPKTLEPTTASEGHRDAGLERPSHPSRAASMRALVEKLEVFVKSQRPALAMTLGGPGGGRFEVERVGPKAVALRLSPRQKLGAADVEGLRSALAARGLTLARYEIA